MAKTKFNEKVILFNENNSVSIQNVIDRNANCVETDTGIYWLQESKTFVDAEKGGMVHIFNVDIPAKVEAENLKKLRRSVVLRNVFKFDRSTGEVDWMKYMPYLVIILLVLFK